MHHGNVYENSTGASAGRDTLVAGLRARVGRDGEVHEGRHVPIEQLELGRRGQHGPGRQSWVRGFVGGTGFSWAPVGPERPPKCNMSHV